MFLLCRALYVAQQLTVDLLLLVQQLRREVVDKYQLSLFAVNKYSKRITIAVYVIGVFDLKNLDWACYSSCFLIFYLNVISHMQACTVVVAN